MEVQHIQKNVLLLPKEVQQEVLDYLDFLMDKYTNNKSEFVSQPLELSELGKSFVEDRMKEMKENPEQNQSWEEVKALLDERMAAIDKNPERLQDWDEVQKELEAELED